MCAKTTRLSNRELKAIKPKKRITPSPIHSVGLNPLQLQSTPTTKTPPQTP